MRAHSAAPRGSVLPVNVVDICARPPVAEAPPLVLCLAGEHGRGCVKPSPSDWCVLCELEKLAVQAYAGSAKVLNPRPLVSMRRALSRGF